MNADYYFNRNWSIRTGIIYYQMGGKDIVLTTTKIDYLNIPLNVNFHFGKNRGFNINAGVTPGFLLDGKLINSTEVRDTTDAIKSFQFGISFGAGYKHPITEKLSLFVDVQVLTETNDHVTNLPSGFDFTRYNSGYSFNLGAAFKL